MQLTSSPTLLHKVEKGVVLLRREHKIAMDGKTR